MREEYTYHTNRDSINIKSTIPLNSMCCGFLINDGYYNSDRAYSNSSLPFIPIRPIDKENNYGK